MLARRAGSVALIVVAMATLSACSQPQDWRFGDTTVVRLEDSVAKIESAWAGSVADLGSSVKLTGDGQCYLQVVGEKEILNSVLCGPVRTTGDQSDSYQAQRIDVVAVDSETGYLVLEQEAKERSEAFDMRTGTRTDVRLVRPDGTEAPSDVLASGAVKAPAAAPKTLPTMPPSIAAPPTTGLDTLQRITARSACPPVRDTRPALSGWQRNFNCGVSLTRTTLKTALDVDPTGALPTTARAGSEYVQVLISLDEQVRNVQGTTSSAYLPNYFATDPVLTAGGREYTPLGMWVQQPPGVGPGQVAAVFEVPAGQLVMSVRATITTQVTRAPGGSAAAPSDGTFAYSVNRTLTFPAR